MGVIFFRRKQPPPPNQWCAILKSSLFKPLLRTFFPSQRKPLCKPAFTYFRHSTGQLLVCAVVIHCRSTCLLCQHCKVTFNSCQSGAYVLSLLLIYPGMFDHQVMFNVVFFLSLYTIFWKYNVLFFFQICCCSHLKYFG